MHRLHVEIVRLVGSELQIQSRGTEVRGMGEIHTITDYNSHLVSLTSFNPLWFANLSPEPEFFQLKSRYLKVFREDATEFFFVLFKEQVVL